MLLRHRRKLYKQALWAYILPILNWLIGLWWLQSECRPSSLLLLPSSSFFLQLLTQQIILLVIRRAGPSDLITRSGPRISNSMSAIPSVSYDTSDFIIWFCYRLVIFMRAHFGWLLSYCVLRGWAILVRPVSKPLGLELGCILVLVGWTGPIFWSGN